MSIVHPVPDAIDHIKSRTEKLFNFNEIRVMELLENVQYGLGYIATAFIAGISLDYLFPIYNKEKETRDLFIEIVAQCILLIIAAFYVRKIVKIMPFLFVINWDIDGDGRIPKYKPYESTEFQGELMMGVIFLSSQINLMKKVELLSERVYKYIFNVEREKSGPL